MSEINFKTLSREMAGREGLGGSTIMFTIIALVGLALVWANWAELDNVTRGEGRIVSSVQNQMVQASEGGVILRRYVSENTVVAEGEVLFEITLWMPAASSTGWLSVLQVWTSKSFDCVQKLTVQISLCRRS